MSGAQRTVCGAVTRLPWYMRRSALIVHGPGATPEDITMDLRCTLEPHEGAHHDFVLSVVGDHAVWVSWATGQAPDTLERRQDCPDPRGCNLWDGHPGAHTPDLTDPLLAEARAAVDRLFPGLPG